MTGKINIRRRRMGMLKMVEEKTNCDEMQMLAVIGRMQRKEALLRSSGR
jgi:hypothetical protein